MSEIKKLKAKPKEKAKEKPKEKAKEKPPEGYHRTKWGPYLVPNKGTTKPRPRGAFDEYDCGYAEEETWFM